MRWVKRLAVTCVAMTFLIMVLGAWVKANDAGLACPDWPACYGQWLPPFPSRENGGTYEGQPVMYSQAQVLYEWTHRAVVSLYALPVLALAILAARGRDLSRPVRWLPAILVIALGIQVILGMVTVRLGNRAWATTLHLASATVIMALATAILAAAYLRPLATGTASAGTDGRVPSPSASGAPAAAAARSPRPAAPAAGAPATPPPGRGYVWQEAPPKHPEDRHG